MYPKLKEIFIDDCDNATSKPSYLVVAVQLPNGAIEIITNVQNISEKMEYYKNAYDDDFCLKNNSSIKIINYMLI